MTTLATLVVRLVGDAGDFRDEMNESSTLMEKFGASVQKAGQVALGVAGGALAALAGAVATIGPGAVSAASDLSESMNKANVVFGKASKAVTEFAKTADWAFGMSQQQATESAASFGNLFNVVGMGQDESAGMSVSMVKLAGDLASFNNIPIADALEKIRAGLIGEAEPLRSVGVLLSDEAMKLKAVEMGLIGANGKLTEAQKVQARYAIILDQTKTAQGDFARTSDGLANTQRILGAVVKNISADIGGALLPGVLQMAKLFSGLVKQILPPLKAGLAAVGPIIERIAAGVALFVTQLQAGMEPLAALRVLLFTILPPELAGQLTLVSQQIAAFIARAQEALAPVIAWVQNNVQMKDVLIALGIAIAAVVIPAIAAVVAGIAPVVLAVVALIAVVTIVRRAWEENWGGIRDKLTEAWAVIQPALAQLWAWLQTNIPLAIQTLANFWTNTLQPALLAMWAFIQETLIPTLAAWWAWLQTNIPLAIQTLAAFWTDTLQPALQAMWAFIQETLIPTLAAWWAYIQENILPILNMLVTLGISVVIASLRGLVGIWTDLVYPALQAMWNYFNKNIIPIMVELARIIKDVLGGAFRFMNDWILKPLGEALVFIISLIDEIIEKAKKMTQALANVVFGDAKTAADVGGDYDGRAAGGPVSALTPYVVGERGPEMFVPSVSGTIVPNAGATNNNYSLTVNTSAPVENVALDFAMLRAMAA